MPHKIDKMYSNAGVVLCFVLLQCLNYVYSYSISEHKHVHCSHEHPKADEVSNYKE